MTDYKGNISHDSISIHLVANIDTALIVAGAHTAVRDERADNASNGVSTRHLLRRLHAESDLAVLLAVNGKHNTAYVHLRQLQLKCLEMRRIILTWIIQRRIRPNSDL